MSETLLKTKLFVPSIRPELVSRPRLIERLNKNMHRKLTLVSAPAGFGKTTLVSDWISHAGVPVAWFSLDEGDNDPIRFTRYLITALNRVEGVGSNLSESILSILEAPQAPPIENILTLMINDIAGIDGRIILVLDDYHLIDTKSIHEAIAFLAEHLPPQLHLVITTRVDPLIPLVRLRARDQLTELRAKDLRFSTSEAAEFLNQVMGLNLSSEDIQALETRTEGWIAGLQLAAISLQGKEDTSGLIKLFSGSHRFVLDYLIEEVLNQQTEETQNFLLQTAILDRLTGS